MRFYKDGTLSDEQILNLFWGRDETAIRETDSKYGSELHRIAFRILGDNEDCEECKNDAYLALWNQIPPARPGSLRGYTATILRRIAINRYYQGKRKREVPSELKVSMEECEGFLSSSETPEDAAVARELGAYINEFLAKLTKRSRFIFLGRFWFVKPVKTLSEELGVSESAVYKELSNLKEDLKSFLESKGVSV